jgi:hypothetical protein
MVRPIWGRIARFYELGDAVPQRGLLRNTMGRARRCEPSNHGAHGGRRDRRRCRAGVEIAAELAQYVFRRLERRRRRDVEHDIEALVAPREVLAGIIDHLVGTEPAHEVRIAGTANANDVRPQVPRNLDRKVADAPGGAVDQHPLTGDDARLVDPCLQRRAAGDWQRGRAGVVDPVDGSRRSSPPG